MPHPLICFIRRFDIKITKTFHLPKWFSIERFIIRCTRFSYSMSKNNGISCSAGYDSFKEKITRLENAFPLWFSKNASFILSYVTILLCCSCTLLCLISIKFKIFGIYRTQFLLWYIYIYVYIYRYVHLFVNVSIYSQSIHIATS